MLSLHTTVTSWKKSQKVPLVNSTQKTSFWAQLGDFWARQNKVFPKKLFVSILSLYATVTSSQK